MITKEHLQRLNAMEDWRAYLDSIHSLREGEIAALTSTQGNPAEVGIRVGTINAYQEMLDMADYWSLLKRDKN